MAELDRRREEFDSYIRSEGELFWKVGFMVLVAIIVVAKTVNWTTAFGGAALLAAGYALHVTITILRAKKAADV